MNFPKPEKRIRLKGKSMRDLNDMIFARDNHRCVICHVWVEAGRKFHHEPCGIFKSDDIHKGVVLCERCHHERHFGKNSEWYKKEIETYLQVMYAPREQWEKPEQMMIVGGEEYDTSVDE